MEACGRPDRQSSLQLVFCRDTRRASPALNPFLRYVLASHYRLCEDLGENKVRKPVPAECGPFSIATHQLTHRRKARSTIARSCGSIGILAYQGHHRVAHHLDAASPCCLKT